METNSKNIDVNKCKYRDKYTNFCLAERNEIGDTYTLCTGTNCYFKNWQRKEQECGKWKNAYEVKQDALQEAEEYTEELEEKYHKLQEQLEAYKIEVEEGKEINDELRAENEKLKKLNDISITHRICLEDDLQQVEKKLKKIKDKCNETLELMDKDSGTNAYAGGRCTEAGQILQIIKEMK